MQIEVPIILYLKKVLLKTFILYPISKTYFVSSVFIKILMKRLMLVIFCAIKLYKITL